MGEKIDLNGKQEETYGKKPEHVNYSKTTRNGMINRHQDSVFIYLFIYYYYYYFLFLFVAPRHKYKLLSLSRVNTHGLPDN